MPNYCSYDMKIRGTKENCKKWHSKMTDYNEANHFFRFFDATIYDEGGTDELYYMCICGDCAWSLETCCRDSGYSEGVDLFAVNTSELSLIMEAWSTEPGMGFQEHYIYDKGQCIADECENYSEWYWNRSEYDSYDDFKKDYDIVPAQEQFDDDGYARMGGFGYSYGCYSI